LGPLVFPATAPAPRPGRVRRILRLWHRAFGLGAALWLLLLALTGSVIAFYDELDAWLNPDLLRVDASVSPALPDVESALRSAAGALPGFAPRYINLPDAPGESLSMLGNAPLQGLPASVQV